MRSMAVLRSGRPSEATLASSVRLTERKLTSSPALIVGAPSATRCVLRSARDAQSMA
jgi:hypothetical protein